MWIYSLPTTSIKSVEFFVNIQQVSSYGNISFFNPIPTYFKQLKKDTDVSRFSYLQETKAMEHVSELMSALETLCNEPELKIKQIIIRKEYVLN